MDKTKTLDYVKLICDAGHMSRDTEDKARLLIIGTEIIHGKRDYRPIAAAAVYIASHITGEFCTQEEVAKAAKTSVASLRKRYWELAKEFELEILF